MNRFMFGFAKSAKDNLDEDELLNYKAAARMVLAMTDEELDAQIQRGNFIEVNGYE